MEIQVAKQRVLFFHPQIPLQEAQERSSVKKIDAFGAFNKVASLWHKPKDDDFECTYEEFRLEPFWHVAATAKYVYDRASTYTVPVSDATVQSVTLHQKQYETQNGHIHVSVLEHCRQEEKEEVTVNGVDGRNDPTMMRYLALQAKDVTDSFEKTLPKNAVVVPPQTRVSAIMRDSLARMIKGIQADTILEEHVEVTCVDLYYRPVYAFQYHWKSKQKDAIVEVDGLSGSVGTGSRIFREYMGKILDRNFLFDVGADAAGMLIPGGSIAVKVAKKYLDKSE